MSASIDYERRALHFVEIGLYQAAQVFATLSLAAATRESKEQ